jgi:hypothetical protein
MPATGKLAAALPREQNRWRPWSMRLIRIYKRSGEGA